jgi:hypothetical protein
LSINLVIITEREEILNSKAMKQGKDIYNTDKTREDFLHLQERCSKERSDIVSTTDAKKN